MRYANPLAMFSLLSMILVFLAGCPENPDTAQTGSQEAPSAEPTSAEISSTSSQTAQTSPTQADLKQTENAKGLPVVKLADIEKIIQQTAEQDRVLVIDFWATWCVPCVEQFDEIHEGLAEIGKEKVRAVTVTFDAPGPTEDKAIAFLKKHDAMKDAYMISPDTDDQIAVVDALGEHWKQLVVPAVFVFNQQGEIVGEYYKGVSEVPEMMEQVRGLTQ